MTSDDPAASLLSAFDYVGRDAVAEVGAPAPPAFAFELDFDSSRRWPDLPYDTGDAAHYTPSDRPPIRAILNSAVETFQHRAPKAWRCVNAELTSAMIRRSSAIDGASSSSNRELVGVCLLTNLHRASDAVSVCVEALVHESIRQHLYRRECANGAFCDLGDEGRYRSPWSGNRIPLHSIIDASLVWYGILGLWCQLAQTVASDAEAAAARQRVAEILFGFAFVRETIEAPRFPRASVAPGIIELIGHMARVGGAVTPSSDARGTIGAFMRASEQGAWSEDLRSVLRQMRESWRDPPAR